MKGRLLKFGPILLLALLPLIPLWRAVFLGQTIGPWDQVRSFVDGQFQHDKGWDILQADSALQFYGWRDQVFEAYRTGHLPVWNHYEFGGAPLLAHSQPGGFYLPHILIGLSHIPTGLGITLLAWFHLALAAIGTYLLIKRLGGSEFGGVIGGAGFALSGFMVAWTPLASVTSTIAWLPLCLWAAFGLQPKFSRELFLLGAFGSMMLLAGHLQFAIYGFLALGIVIAYRAITERWQVAGTGLAAIAMACLIASPQLLPVLKAGQTSHRKTEPTWEKFQGYNGMAIQPFELLSIADPTFLGMPSETVQLQQQPLTGYWPALVQRGASFAETAIGFGPMILAALCLGLSWRSLKSQLGMTIVGVLGLLLAMGTIVGAILYFGVPGWSATGNPCRASVLFVLAGCTIAGSLFGRGETTNYGRRTILFGVILLVSAAALSQIPLGSWIPNFPAEDLAAARPSTLTLLARVVAGGASGLLLYVAVTTPQESRKWMATIGAIAAFAVPSALLIPTGDANLPSVNPPSDPYVRVAIINNSWDLLTQSPAHLPPNLCTILKIHELSGYDSLIDKSIKARLEDIDGKDPAPPANGNMLFVKPGSDPTKLAEAGVSEIWSPSAEGLARQKLEGPGRASVDNAGQKAHVTAESADSLSVDADGPGQFVLRDNLDPKDWNLLLDGKSVSWSADPYPAIKLEEGQHHLVFLAKTSWWPLILLLLAQVACFCSVLASKRVTNARATINEGEEERKTSVK